MNSLKAFGCGWVAEAKRIWREVIGNMKAADYEPLIAANRADAAKVQAKVKAAREELDRKYVELEIAGDRVAIQRLRKRVRDAQDELRELDYAHERLVAARSAAVAGELAANSEARWRKAEQLAARWQAQGEEIGATLVALSEQARAFLETGKDLYRVLDGDDPKQSMLPDDIKGGHVLWRPDRLAREIDLQLWGLSDGLLAPKSGGVGIGTPYHVRGGPDFKRRVRESIALAFKGRSQTSGPQPPEAA